MVLPYGGLLRQGPWFGGLLRQEYVPVACSARVCACETGGVGRRPLAPVLERAGRVTTACAVQAFKWVWPQPASGVPPGLPGVGPLRTKANAAFQIVPTVGAVA